MKNKIEKLLDLQIFLEFLFDNIASAVFLVDDDFKIQRVNNAFQTLFGIKENNALNRLFGNGMQCSYSTGQNKLCGESSFCSKCDVRKNLIKSFSNKEKIYSAYITRDFYIKNKPVTKYLRMKIKHLKFQNKGMAVLVVDDVTELEEQKVEIQDMANRDYLTKLYNRRFFFDMADQLYKNAKRNNSDIAVAMMDIDFFKKVNDSYGHDAGDFVLKGISKTLMKNVRESDVVARFGGEEFCLLITNSKPDAALKMVEKIRQIIEKEIFVFNKTEISVTISCGLAAKLGSSLGRMIKDSDSALYQAKDGGRNRCVSAE